MQVILLERIEKLGHLGDQVTVKPGFARNYLLPQGKALRATSDNIAYFEKERKAIEANNAKNRDAAAKDAKNVEGVTVDLIRQASESGQLYGSVTGRDIAEAVSEASKIDIKKSQINLNDNLKMLGLFPVSVSLHAEVVVDVTVNIARSSDEAKIQRDTGKALINVEEEAEQEEETKQQESVDQVEAAETEEKAEDEAA